MNTAKHRKISPPREDWGSLRQPLQTGEIQFVDWLDAHLARDWEIYIKPHLNGCCPDVVILNPKVGIGVFEVKDWDFDALHYYIKKCENGRNHLMAKKNEETISFVRKNPVDQLLLYRREIIDIYCPILSKEGYSLSVTCGLIMTQAKASHIRGLIEPIFLDRNRKILSEENPNSNYFVMSSESFREDFSNVVPKSINRFSSRYMNPIIASALRIWLVEPESDKEQREKLNYSPAQQEFIRTRTKSGYRRLRGPAGSGKSIVVAGRAATLLSESKEVLIVTFNITLLNYLQDLTVRIYPKARKEAVWLNFHALCKRICYSVGMQKDYADLFLDLGGKDFPDSKLFCAVINSAIDISSTNLKKYDAILVDEGQDFNPNWWSILRRLVVTDGEMLLVADSTQDIYESSRLWTDEVMSSSGFRGAWAELETTYRLPDNLIPLANDFAKKHLPKEKVIISKKIENQLDLPLEGGNCAQLRWLSVPSILQNEIKKIFLDFRRDVGSSGLSASDITILVQNNEIGVMVCHVLDNLGIKHIDIFGKNSEETKRKKMYFFKGDARTKICTVHSFKGWEAKAVLIFFGSLRSNSDYALLYTAITRLKSGVGSILYTVCSDKNLKYLEDEWSGEYNLNF